MNMKKVSIAAIVGAVVSFFLGWLLYGFLLKDFMEAHMNNSTMRPEEDMIWWAMILSNLAWAFLLAYIFNRWANISTLGAGLSAGALISLLFSVSLSLGWYAFSTLYVDMTGMLVDIAMSTIMGAIVGAVIGLVLGKIKD